jgi:hypothetical protein
MELNEVVAKIEEILDRYIDPEVGGDHSFIMYEVRRMSRQLQEAQEEVERLKLAELVAETALRVLQEYDEPILGDDGICEMIDDTLRLAISVWQRTKGIEKNG